MLLRRHTRRSGRLFAKTQEPPDPIPELGQVPHDARILVPSLAAISSGAVHFLDYITLRCFCRAAAIAVTDAHELVKLDARKWPIFSRRTALAYG